LGSVCFIDVSGAVAPPPAREKHRRLVIGAIGAPEEGRGPLHQSPGRPIVRGRWPDEIARRCADALAHAPRMVAEPEPLSRREHVRLAVDREPARSPTTLVVADDVDVDPTGLPVPDEVPFLEEGG